MFFVKLFIILVYTYSIYLCCINNLFLTIGIHYQAAIFIMSSGLLATFCLFIDLFIYLFIYSICLFIYNGYIKCLFISLYSIPARKSDLINPVMPGYSTKITHHNNLITTPIIVSRGTRISLTFRTIHCATCTCGK